MKNFFTILALFFIFQESNAQITLDHSYPNSAEKMSVINLANSGFKYCRIDMVDMLDNQITLYNPDHSVFKTMSFAGTSNQENRTVWYISENTFDLDNDIEFMVTYGEFFSSNYLTRIYNEDGSILFERIGEGAAWFNERSPHDQINAIFSTPSGTKMILNSNVDGSSKIYSLPGSLPLALNETPNITPDYDIRLFPNPTRNKTISIAYTLPENVTLGKVNIYNTAGQIVKILEIDKNFSTIELSTDSFAVGTYICEIIGNSKRISTSQFIVQN